jgi:hypothetical protein
MSDLQVVVVFFILYMIFDAATTSSLQSRVNALEKKLGIKEEWE